MRWILIAAAILLCTLAPAAAQVNVGIGLPGISIGINLPVYPQLVVVPGYPVYYAPQLNSNYFFYDGMYWVYERDNWYASSWYNGPWGLVPPQSVPLYVLRVPVRYYRQPPAYFHGWRGDAPPRWGEHWGNGWAQSHNGWDHWDRAAVMAPAPLPTYQRQYAGNRYPRVEQQQVIQTQNYRYQPKDTVVQQHYQAQHVQPAPMSSPQARQAPVNSPMAPDARATSRPPTGMPNAHPQAAQASGGNVQNPVAALAPPPQRAAPVQPQVTQARPQSRSQPQQQPQLQPSPQTQGQAQAQQNAGQRQSQANKGQAQDKAQQGRAPARESNAQHPSPQPQPQPQAAAQHQPAPKAQGHDNAPQGNAPKQEAKQGQDKGHDRGETQGGERGK